MIAKWAIYCLTGNTVKMLKVGYIKRSFDKIKCVSNPLNADVGDLPFYCYRKQTGQQSMTQRWKLKLQRTILDE